MGGWGRWGSTDEGTDWCSKAGMFMKEMRFRLGYFCSSLDGWQYDRLPAPAQLLPAQLHWRLLDTAK